ncbi:hypothetical protein [Glycomyces salinus]|uniref:hypothetical protein n=1 Tax=Glycomyces salinus TaxID=980294 RepID=UPI0018EAD879|nr:hypothetical protein [Glycomyces salinus]
MTNREARLGRTAGWALTILFAAGACGGDDDGDPVATAGGDDESESTASVEADEESLAFAECMRDNGVDMPDPEPGLEGLMEALNAQSGEYDDAAVNDALDACEDLMPSYADEPETPIDEEALLEHNECLREQGIEVSDDLTDTERFEDADPDELTAALEACDHVFDGGEGTAGDDQ